MAVLPTGIGPVTGYNIERSLRFNSADSAYLNRTPGSAGNRDTWTLSVWVKRSKSVDFRTIFSAATDTSNLTIVRFTDGDKLEVRSATSGSTVFQLVTTQLFRDYSAWYHIVLAVDTTNATGGNRVRLYVNGSEVTVFDTDTNPTQNADSWVNSTALHEIGRQANNASNYYYDGYITECYLIDGSQKTPSDFGETDIDTGVWKPKAYSGTYGTNGFFLKFADNSGTTSTTLGKDSSGNGNNWTPNNFSVTAGAGNDSLVDSPTPYGTDTGAGGTVRGNYCTWNPLKMGNITLTNGALRAKSTAAAYNGALATMQFPSGKIYFEGTIIAVSVGNNLGIGMASPTSTLSGRDGATDNNFLYIDATNSVGALSYAMYGSGNNYTALSLGSSAVNDVMMVAYDYDTGKIWLGANGTWYNSGNPASGTNPTATMTNPSNKFPYMLGYSSSEIEANFGQRAFAYTAPSGFKALCTQNLPTPAVVQGDDYFNTVTFTGDSTSNRTITTGLQSDFVWTKRRNDAYGHLLFDAIRGAGRTLRSQDSAAESNDGGYYVQQFNSTNFLIGATDNALNHSSGTYVAWVWNAGGSNATNTSGSITSTVRASTTAGFSVVTYTGTGANATVGHGLGVAPSMIIAKRRNGIADWMVAHSGVNGGTNPFNYYMLLNTTAAQTADSTAWNNTAPTSTVFSLGSGGNVNSNGATNVAYCFAPVAGYSAFGSYTGNGSTDGPFVYTGFRPRYVLIKRTDSTANWEIWDTTRSVYNQTYNALYPNLSNAEDGGNAIDINSNGFKLRDTGGSTNATASATYIYAAFAESPFKYSLAR